jgi:hypothetical protein
MAGFIPDLGTITGLAGYQSVPGATGIFSLNGLSTVQRWSHFFWAATLTQKLMAVFEL